MAGAEGGAECVHKAGCSQGDGSRLYQAGKGWQPWSVPPWVQNWIAELPGKRTAMHFSPSVKSVFLSPTFLQRTKPFLECIGLLCLAVKPHSPRTFFFLFILQLLCWSEELDPVLFSYLGAFKWRWWWFFQFGSLPDGSIIRQALILKPFTVQTAGQDSKGLFCNQLLGKSRIPQYYNTLVALEQRSSCDVQTHSWAQTSPKLSGGGVGWSPHRLVAVISRQYPLEIAIFHVFKYPACSRTAGTTGRKAGWWNRPVGTSSNTVLLL